MDEQLLQLKLDLINAIQYERRRRLLSYGELGRLIHSEGTNVCSALRQTKRAGNGYLLPIARKLDISVIIKVQHNLEEKGSGI